MHIAEQRPDIAQKGAASFRRSVYNVVISELSSSSSNGRNEQEVVTDAAADETAAGEAEGRAGHSLGGEKEGINNNALIMLD